MTNTNPLLDLTDLPRFDLIQPEHVKPAIESLLADGRALTERLTADTTPATWTDFAGALFDGLEPFSRAWGIVGHLHSVNDVPAWREAYNEMLPEVSRFYAELGQNLKLFEKYKALRESGQYSDVAPWNNGRSSITRCATSACPVPNCRKTRNRASRQSGRTVATVGQVLGKPARRNQRLRRSDHRRSRCSPACPTMPGRPQGPPQKKLASKAGTSPCTRRPTVRSCSTPTTANCAPACTAPTPPVPPSSRGSSKPEWDNTPLITRMLELRQEDAKMLGFGNYAEVSLAPKMADTPAQVLAFLRELAAKATPFRRKGRCRVARLCPERTRHHRLPAWDAAYVSEKLLQERYAFSEQEVKQYFTEPKVLGGPVQGHREPVLRPGQAGHGAGLARGRQVLPPGNVRRQTRRPVLPRPLCPRNQARRRLDGRSALRAGGPPAASRHRWPT